MGLTALLGSLSLVKLWKDMSATFLPLRACILARSTEPEPSLTFAIHSILAVDSQLFRQSTTAASASRTASECHVRATAKQLLYKEHRAPNLITQENEKDSELSKFLHIAVPVVRGCLRHCCIRLPAYKVLKIYHVFLPYNVITIQICGGPQ